MTNYPHSGDLAILEAQQAGAETTINAAIARIFMLMNLSIIDRDDTAPPGSPAEGDRYLVATGGSGDWSGHDDELAYYFNATWYFVAPEEGWVMWVSDEATLLVYDGAAWQTVI